MQRNRGYRFVFWGFVLNFLNIFPDFIDVFIMAKGISMVLEDTQNKELKQARQFCNIYLGVKAIAFFVEGQFFGNLAPTFDDSLTIILFAANAILNITIIFYLFVGSEMLLVEGRKDCFMRDGEKGETYSMVRDLSKGAIIFVVIYASGTLFMMPGRIFANEFSKMFSIGLIAVILASVWAAHNIAYIRRQYPVCK